MKTSPLSLLVLSIVAFAGGCAGDPVSSTIDDLIMPLAVGNNWVQRVTNYDSTGASRATYLDTIRIVSHESVKGETWARSSMAIIKRINRSSGLWQQFDGGDQMHVAKYPAAVGDTFGLERFQQTFENGSQGERFFDLTTVTSIDTSITVPAGTFRCYAYRRTGAWESGAPVTSDIFMDTRTYYAPRQGPILTEVHAMRADGTIYLQQRIETLALTVN